MRRLFLSVLGVFAVAGVASAELPKYAPVTAPAPAYHPSNQSIAPAAVAGQPVQPASGSSGVRGNGCTNCGSAKGAHVRGAFTMATGGDCKLGYGCQNGCGSVKSDLAFHFGSCKNFFNACGPTCGGLFNRDRCPTTPFAAPFGTGWQCPRQYDTYANH